MIVIAAKYSRHLLFHRRRRFGPDGSLTLADLDVAHQPLVVAFKVFEAAGAAAADLVALRQLRPRRVDEVERF